MKLLVALLILLALPFLLVAAIPVLTVGLALLLVCGSVLIWVLPILFIAVSDRASGGEKLAWILATIFLSWFAWIFYFLLAPIKATSRHPGDYYREYRYR